MKWVKNNDDSMIFERELDAVKSDNSGRPSYGQRF